MLNKPTKRKTARAPRQTSSATRAQLTPPRSRRPITPDDLLKFQFISSSQISPDGSQIVFVEKHAGEKNKYVTNLWMVDTAGGHAHQFTSYGKDTAPQWSPDGSRIAFVRSPEKQPPQIYMISALGGEATPLSRLPEGSIGALRWAPDGRYLAISFREQDPDWTEEIKKKREETGLSDLPRVIDDWWYRLDGDGYFNAQRFQLFLVDAATGEHRLLYAKDTLGTFTFDFSPDSEQLVASTNRDKKALIKPWKDELVRVDVASGKVTPIPGLPQGPKTSVRWSPDGKTIAYAGRTGTDGVYSVENLELYVCHPTKGEARSLSAGEDHCLLACAISDAAEARFEPVLQFSPDSQRIYVQLGVRGEVHVASVPTRGGSLVLHTQGAIDISMGNISAHGSRMALTLGTTTRLAELAMADCTDKDFALNALADLNGPLLSEIELVEPKSH